MIEYVAPEGYTLGPVDQTHGNVEMFKDGVKVGKLYWHGRQQAFMMVNTTLGTTGTVRLGGYCDGQEGLYRIAAMCDHGGITLPGKVEAAGKSYEYVDVKPYRIGEVDGEGGFNLMGPFRRSAYYPGKYICTITRLSDGTWRAAWFDYSLTPLQIARSMKVIAEGATRQEAIDGAIKAHEEGMEP